jgi:adhesin/invasin
VKVTDQFGNPIAGVAVNFAVASGGGTVTGAAQTTGADGVATVGSWTIGQTVGTNVLRATATGATITTGNPADFTSTGIAGAPAVITKIAGDQQAQLAGSGLVIAPTVSLADQFGNSIFNQTVTFEVTSGGGLLTGATPSTNTAGIASLGSWNLGSTPGINTMTATAGGLSVIFQATALALLDVPQYLGTYSGTWTNTSFGSTDVASLTIVDIPGTGAGLTLSAAGTIMGTPGGIPSTQRTATYTATNAFFNGNIPQLGNFNLNVSSSATPNVLDIVAGGTGVPNGAVRRWDAQGTITPTQINMTFIVSFATGNPAIGAISLTKP